MAELLTRELGRGSDLLTSALARSAALGRARDRCRGVLVPTAVTRRPDGVVAFSVPVASGASLAEIRGTRALTLGECITIGVGVADALAAMHAERLAHGDVSPANVVARGKAVTLVDTMGALSEERGTPGFAPPDRHAGADPAADVYSLGLALRSLADDAAKPAIDAWTEPLLAADPSERPTAAHAAAALARCAPTEPIRPPEAPVVAAMRAGVIARTEKRPQDRWWRAERTAIKLSPLAALAVVGVISGAALVPAVAAGPERLMEGSTAHIGAATPPVRVTALEGPRKAAISLTERRIAALAASDAAGLLAVSLPGGEAARADQSTALGLRTGDLAFDGLTLLSADARVVEATQTGAIVEVTTALSGYSVGQEEVAAGEATALLELRLTQSGWLVERILPPP
ncbi:hypothetical protein [Demequina sp.]|uniref:hypothetical protein n=1 Tax=Demequina sp. TaxID=2050685 RepID=UPI003D11C08B